MTEFIAFIGLLYLASISSVLLPVGAGCFQVNYLNLPSRILLYYFVITFLIEITAAYLAFKGINNMLLSHLHSILEFVCLCLVYYYAYPKGKGQFIIKYLILGFVLFALAYINSSGGYKFNSLPRIVENLGMISLGIGYLLYLNEKLPVQHLEKFSMFWITSAVLIYFAGTLLLCALGDLLSVLANEYPIDIWNVHACLSIVFNSLCAIGLWLSRQTSVSSSTVPAQ